MKLVRIVEVRPLAGYRLELKLTTGAIVERDVSAFLVGPVFRPLRKDPAEFQNVRVEGGAVVWPNGADICPDVLIWGGISPKDAAAKSPPRFLKLRASSRAGHRKLGARTARPRRSASG